MYNLKDHPDNNRVTLIGTNLGGAADIVQTNNYFSFGLVMSQTNGNTSPTYRKNRYLYNNKEIQSENVTGEAINWYDYGARFYDPQIGRFQTNDPLAEKYLSSSTYSYCFDNPIRIIDPDGRSATNYDDEQGNRLLTKNDGNNSTITVKKDKRLAFDSKVQNMKEKGTINYKQSNVDLIGAVTPAIDGVFFTDKQMAWMYMTNND